VAQLIGDPFWMSFADVAELTDHQILRVVYHPRDDKGSLKAPPVEFPVDATGKEADRAALFGFGSMLGIPAEELEQVWRTKYAD